MRLNGRIKNDCSIYNRCLIGELIVLLNLVPGMVAALREIFKRLVKPCFFSKLLLVLMDCIKHELECWKPVREVVLRTLCVYCCYLKELKAVVQAIKLVPVRTSKGVVFQAFVLLICGFPAPAKLIKTLSNS